MTFRLWRCFELLQLLHLALNWNFGKDDSPVRHLQEQTNLSPVTGALCEGMEVNTSTESTTAPQI